MPFHLLPSSALPIFRKDFQQKALFYTPGYLAAVDFNRAQDFENRLLQTEAVSENGMASALRKHARQALEAREQRATRPFSPVCLTLYLHNRCNLKCRYCYSMSESTTHPADRLSLDSVRAAAPVVMAHCKARNLPLTVVLHGGGEPTLDQAQADSILDFLERDAAERGLSVFRYIATNGALSVPQAEWLGRRFDRIGLSCDGPADIQNRQRPLRTGGESAGAVERTARILRDQGKSFHIRATITPETMERQAEIADYLCARLHPDEIHVEPVYLGGRAQAENIFPADMAESFTAEFFRAQGVARGYGIPWSTSGSRLREMHGPYCHIFRDVLNLAPGGLATACFKLSTKSQIRERGLSIGSVAPIAEGFTLDSTRLLRLRRILSGIPQNCGACFNQFHCTGLCPDYCPLDSVPVKSIFRCRIQMLMTETLLMESALALGESSAAETGIGIGEQTA